MNAKVSYYGTALKIRKRQQCVLAVTCFLDLLLDIRNVFATAVTVKQKAVVGFITTHKRHITRTNAVILTDNKTFLTNICSLSVMNTDDVNLSITSQ